MASSSRSPPILHPSHEKKDPVARDQSPQGDLPVTPVRGRTRYPATLSKDDAKSRTKRNGAPQTYERLEDLLREAGYKETRVFTPETDRADIAQGTDGSGIRTSSLPSNPASSTMVNFLRAWIPSKSSLLDISRPSSPSRMPPSPSPSPLTRTLSNSNSSSNSSSIVSHQQPRPQSSLNPIIAPHARARLRHIASAPNVPKHQGARSLRPSHPLPKSSSRTTLVLNERHAAPFLRAARADTTLGLVTTTNVLCRSAPSSRSSSRVRRKSSTQLPCLAKTESLNEPWPSAPLSHSSRPPEESDDDDEEVEVDLTTILIPPKRQKSIRSLRRHLDRSKVGGRQLTDQLEAQLQWEALGMPRSDSGSKLLAGTRKRSRVSRS
ncbi:hypothetical protein SISNIDRAFT_483353 [Sistotremastrum niveocremeum HHB9708]|uniref:Uncharacterized protein n=2 Tax=Sistotremastraceae TaxID=3402574 RepID=A0A164XFW0_9AGAM|nr:hypothetical protein SISNIDRAFT_483353 [Sistotremastrum niveocremeum HHB9708]KZT41340.1 hypothetical protein SISSUDRAFT_1059483 [Sistotremastrum suecicum HHB10207 ss-3]